MFSVKLKCMTYDQCRAYMNLLVGIRNNDIGLVRQAIDLGFDLNIKNNYSVAPALILAAPSSDTSLEIWQMLVKNGAEVNIADFSTTPLYLAVMYRNIRFIEFLIEHGADVNYKDINNCSILYISIKNKNIEIVKLLVANGADIFDNCSPDMFDRLKYESLFDYAKRCSSTEIINFLKTEYLEYIRNNLRLNISEKPTRIVFGYLGSNYSTERKKIKRNCNTRNCDICVIS